MEKYLGNKSSLLPAIHSFVNSRLPSAHRLSDLFTGTTNVGRFFAARGFDIDVNDLNRFSYVLAQAYLGLAKFPSYDLLHDLDGPTHRVDRLHLEFLRTARRLADSYPESLSETERWSALAPTARTLAALQELGERNRAIGPITRWFTTWGDRSTFTSLRGTCGKRNYFSKENALFLDGVLRAIRGWWRDRRLTRDELFVLMTSVLEEIVITANVNGTFHDFNRERLWPNALQRFFLRVPLVTPACGSIGIANDDALSAAKYVPRHDVCYVDPPYNFRQYTAYYHFLNFVAAWPFLDSVEDYLDGLSHVRGQNMLDDTPSQFCRRNTFLESLRDLFEGIDASHVVLSYYNGRNHWNHWSKVDCPTSEGLGRLKDLFADECLFTAFEAVPAAAVRLNYQSRGGEQKSWVNEYLLIGSKVSRPPRKRPAPAPLLVNQTFGLQQHFRYERTRPEKAGESRRIRRFG